MVSALVTTRTTQLREIGTVPRERRWRRTAPLPRLHSACRCLPPFPWRSPPKTRHASHEVELGDGHSRTYILRLKVYCPVVGANVGTPHIPIMFLCEYLCRGDCAEIIGTVEHTKRFALAFGCIKKQSLGTYALPV